MVFLILVLCCGCAQGVGSKQNKTQETQEEAPEEEAKEQIVVGFSQLGAESDWRSANTQSMKETFTAENGYELIFEDGQQKQANQMTAIRMFIQQEVDYIVLAPVTETGWETVLQEAKDAGIPVIIVDRMVDVPDENLFTCWVGSDFELEGKKMTNWLYQFTQEQGIAPSDIHIANIQGTIGASAQIGRSKGLEDAVKEYGWDLLAEVEGDFTQTKGKEAMEALLNEYENLNVVYCENDNEAFGAIEAIEDAGRKAGSDIQNGDIMVLSFDAVNKQALSYALADKISCVAECNPLHGPRVQAIIETLEEGKKPDKYEYVEEQVYSANTKVKTLCVDGKVYNVSILTPDLIAQKTGE